MTARRVASRLREERGFTLIEILAAMVVLLVGVLGAVSLIDGANATTSFTKGREGATNLARELLESSRSVDYDKVTTASLPGELQQKPGLGDASGDAGWQIRRRGIVYTVQASACIFDDGTDDAGTHDDGAGFCSGSATSPSGDHNPDDYRRVTFDLTWKDRRNLEGKVSQTGLITNPSGGLGPAISGFDCTNCQSGDKVGSDFGSTNLAFSVVSAPADSVRWSADDGNSAGNAGGGPTSWTFTWNIRNVGAFTCGTPPSWTVDGSYVVSAQAFDSRSVPGDLRTKIITIDRSAPSAPCGLAGGRNGGIVDLQWLANPERDITGYRVYRVKVGGETNDTLVCPLSTKTSCYDPNPPDAATYPTVQYYVEAEDGGGRKGRSGNLTVAQTGNTAPNPPPTLSAAFVDGLPTLTWTAATDPDGSIRFYRIYRDGTDLAHRYDATGGPGLTWTDRDEQGGHSYWVTAVDDKFRESTPVGPVTP